MAILDKVHKIIPRIKTAAGYIQYAFRAKDVRMEDNTDLETKITEINNNLINQCKIGTVTLGYYNASYLYATMDLGTNKWNGGIIFTSMFEIRNTPYEQVISFSTTEVQGNEVTIWARGSGFVDGHSLLVGYLIMPKNF